MSSLPTAVTLGRSRQISKNVAKSIASQATVVAIYSDDLDESKFNTLLNALHPRPQGRFLYLYSLANQRPYLDSGHCRLVLLIGGGFSDPVADEATTLFKAFRTKIESEEGEEEEKDQLSTVVRIKIGTLEGKGPGAIIEAIKAELTKVFG